MATQYSNKPIVTNGLVYALDFGNQKSYNSATSSGNFVQVNSIFKTLNYTTTNSTLLTGSVSLTGVPSPLPYLDGNALLLYSTSSISGSYITTNQSFPFLAPESGNGTVSFLIKVANNASTVIEPVYSLLPQVLLLED